MTSMRRRRRWLSREDEGLCRSRRRLLSGIPCRRRCFDDHQTCIETTDFVSNLLLKMCSDRKVFQVAGFRKYAS